MSTLARATKVGAGVGHEVDVVREPCEEREFYLRMAIKKRWNVRELARQIELAAFERSVLGPPKLSTALRVLYPEAARDFKDLYSFECLVALDVEGPRVPPRRPRQAELLSGGPHFGADKRAAARTNEDARDIRFLAEHLHLTSAESVLGVVLQFYPEEQLPVRTRLLIEEMFG